LIFFSIALASSPMVLPLAGFHPSIFRRVASLAWVYLPSHASPATLAASSLSKVSLSTVCSSLPSQIDASHRFSFLS